ncbi:phage tail protein [Leptospira sp. 96542]|nr:phage tail protein [Leptospira sp. 96542]
MYKLNSLRRHLKLAVPELGRDPEKLSILMRKGRVVCAGEASLSFEYAYTAQIVLVDYSGEADSIMLPLLVWLRTHQSEYFDNDGLREHGFRFDVEYNNNKTVDLEIELELTEAVVVRPQAGQEGTAPGRYTLNHIKEPLRAGSIGGAEEWEIQDIDGTVLATWSYGPLELDNAPRLDE